MSLTWNFQRVGRIKPKNPLWGEYEYFLEQHNILIGRYSLMFLSTSINVSFTHDPTSYVAFLPQSCLNKGFVVVVVVEAQIFLSMILQRSS